MPEINVLKDTDSSAITSGLVSADHVNVMASARLLTRSVKNTPHEVNTSKVANLLSYVHLRNIHRSTGAGRVARQLTEHLAKRSDINLRVLADPADHKRIVPLVGEPWNTFAYEFTRSETSVQQAKWFILNRPAAERYWPEVDIVFCTAESYVPTRRARLVVTLHDAAYFENAAHKRDSSFSRTRLKWKWLFRKLDRKADLFHTVSNFSAERLGHFFPEFKSRIRVVHNAVAPMFFSGVSRSGSAYLETRGLNARPFVLLPGGLHFRKNADLVLQAWPLLQARHPDLTLVIVNHSNPEYALRATELGPSIQLVGFVPDDALRALYGAAQVVWFPSRYEGFGLPVVEAMACGAAVVASNASSLPEIAGDAAVLASPQKAEDHVDSISSLVGNVSLQREYSRRGQAHARLFTWEQSAAQMKHHFDSLL